MWQKLDAAFHSIVKTNMEIGKSRQSQHSSTDNKDGASGSKMNNLQWQGSASKHPTYWLKGGGNMSNHTNDNSDSHDCDGKRTHFKILLKERSWTAVEESEIDAAVV